MIVQTLDSLNRLQKFIEEQGYPASETLMRITEEYSRGFIGFRFASEFLKAYHTENNDEEEYND